MEYDLVYHYTTLSGLKGILGTQTLHATHFAFLNDSKEIYQIRPRLVETALPIMTKLYEDVAASSEQKRQQMAEEGGVAALADHDSSAVVDAMYRITLGLDGGTRFFQPFVVSFCGHKEMDHPYERQHGLLSMWRAYGKDVGYAIVFDTKALTAMLKDEFGSYRYDAWGIASAIYDTSQDVFKEEFIELIDAMNKYVPQLFSNKKVMLPELLRAFMRDVSRFKHRGFTEEQEVRIFISPTHDKLFERAKVAGEIDKREDKEIKFRDTLAPYIVLFDNPKIKLPIKRIIVGPHADKERRLAKLKSYLDILGLKIDISCSETPLV